MSSQNGASRVNGTTPTTAQLEADVVRQREQLAGTIDALQARLDVRARALGKVHGLRQQATTDAGRPRPQVAAALAGVVVLVTGLVYLRRRR